jgi:type I restriction enzyme S subunit
VSRARVGDVLALERLSADPDPLIAYTSVGVRSFGRGLFHYEPKLGDQLGSLRFFELQPNRLVISNIKAWEGAVALSGEEDRGCLASNRFLTYAPIDDRIDVTWARWFFLSDAGLGLLQHASPGSADRNRTLAIKRFEALEIPLPPIEEQRRVARLLDQAQAGAGTIARLIDRAGSVEAALQIALVSAEDSARPTPEAQSWRTVELGAVMQPSRAFVAVDPTASYRLTGVYSFGKGLIDRGTIFGSETSYRTLTALRDDDVVMSKLNGWEGAVAVVDPPFAGSCVSAEFPTFRIDQTQLLPQFFGALAKAPGFWEALSQSARGSMVRRRRIGPHEFLRAQVRLPSVPVQREAVRRLSILSQAAGPRREASRRADSVVSALLNREFDTQYA